MKTSPFDLGLAEAGHPLITRAGKRVASFEMTSHESFPIRVMVPGSGGFGNGSYAARADGRMHPENDSDYDLFLLIEDNAPMKGSPEIDGRSSPYETRVTRLTVNKPNGPIFSELATHIEIEDEAGGEFISIRQQGDHAKVGAVNITAEEWPHIKDAIEQLLPTLQNHE